MKKKIVGIFICMLLSATILPATMAHDGNTISSIRKIDVVPVVDFEEIQGGLFRIMVQLTNTRMGAADNIYWEITAENDLFFYPKIKNGEFDVLSLTQTETIKVFPVLGFGKVNITFYCKFKIVKLSSDVEIEVKQEWRDQAFLFWHSFPEMIQPVKEWVVIENYSYFYNKSDAIGVELYYEGINNMHNVRVVMGRPSFFQEVEFLAACKFTDGIGTLYEYGITEDLVMRGDVHWAVELVDGG